MVTQQLLLICLFSTQAIIGQPVEIKQQHFKLPFLNESNAIEVNNMSETSDNLYDDGADFLLTKISELTESYRQEPNATIADVQRMLEADPSLPRLTRGEVVEILDNLTKSDPDELRKKVEKTREDYQRAIMLVMPYTPKNTDNPHMEELYTKPPITHIIGSETDDAITTTKLQVTQKDVLRFESTTSRPHPPRRRTRPPKFNRPVIPKQEEQKNAPFDVGQSFQPSNLPSLNEEQQVSIVTEKIKPQYQPPVTKDDSLLIKEESQSIITKESSSTENYPSIVVQENQPIDKEQMPPLVVDQKPINKQVPPKTQIFARRPVKPQRFSNHKYPEDTEPVSINQGMRVVTAPTLVTNPETINVDFWHSPQKQRKPQNESKQYVRPQTMQSSVYKASVSSTVKPKTRSTTIFTTTTTQSPYHNIGLPEDLKDMITDFQPVDPPKSHKYSSHYDESVLNIPKHGPTTENIRDILDSIGVMPKKSTTTPVPDIKDIADNLSPEMRDLLMSFGLIDDPNKKKVEPNVAPAVIAPADTADAESHINPLSFSQFKPLPDSAPSRQDMEEFLAGFGLTGNSQRSSKELKVEEPATHLSDVPDFSMEMIPESMHDVLADIGLSDRRPKKISSEEVKKSHEKTHVFKPENTYVNNDEIKRLNQLLETIKRLEKLNRTASIEDLKDLDIENIKELTKILKLDSTTSLDQLKEGPNPLDFADYGAEKNEVKRQQSSTTEKTTKNPSLALLEESFGGTPSSVSTTEATIPPPTRRTGFYFLVDWNKFLEVGEEGKNKVNIRFSPQAGDPSRFLRVTVP